MVISSARGEISGAGGRGAAGRQSSAGLLAHAELNALLALDEPTGADPRPVDVHTLEIFSALEPCPLCMGAICMSGVKKVHYAARDAWAGSANLLDATPYYRWKQITAFPPDDPQLELVIHILQVEDRLNSRHSRAGEVLDKWSQDYPENIRIGRLIHQTGEIPQMRVRGFSASQAIDRIHELAETRLLRTVRSQ